MNEKLNSEVLDLVGDILTPSVFCHSLQLTCRRGLRGTRGNWCTAQVSTEAAWRLCTGIRLDWTGPCSWSSKTCTKRFASFSSLHAFFFFFTKTITNAPLTSHLVRFRCLGLFLQIHSESVNPAMAQEKPFCSASTLTSRWDWKSLCQDIRAMKRLNGRVTVLCVFTGVQMERPEHLLHQRWLRISPDWWRRVSSFSLLQWQNATSYSDKLRSMCWLQQRKVWIKNLSCGSRFFFIRAWKIWQ